MKMHVSYTYICNLYTYTHTNTYTHIHIVHSTNLHTIKTSKIHNLHTSDMKVQRTTLEMNTEPF